jgi:outer membrane protein TolC
MRNIIIILLFMRLGVYAQVTDYNKIILPNSIVDVSFEEKLIQLAWNNHPSSKIALQNVQLYNKEKNLTGWSWLENINATFNVNQFNIDPSSDPLGRAGFYPRYNISMRMSLGTLALTPINTKIARDRVIIGEQQVNELKLSIRKDMLVQIEQFKERYKVLRLRDRLKEDFLVLFKDAEKKFSQGEIQIEQYQMASQAYYTRSEAVITAVSQFNQTKIALEELIGLRLEEVEGYNSFLNQLEAEIRSN